MPLKRVGHLVYSALRHVESQRGWANSFLRPPKSAFDGDIGQKTALQRQLELKVSPLKPEPYAGVQYFEEPCASCLGYTNTLPPTVVQAIKAGEPFEREKVCFERPI